MMKRQLLFVRCFSLYFKENGTNLGCKAMGHGLFCWHQAKYCRLPPIGQARTGVPQSVWRRAVVSTEHHSQFSGCFASFLMTAALAHNETLKPSNKTRAPSP